MKKKVLIIASVLVLAVCGALLTHKIINDEESVGFEVVKAENILGDISLNVIPEYRDMERALACLIDNQVYVVVTRGEKPTSGFRVSVDKIIKEDNNGRTNLIVCAGFKDPEKNNIVSQILTYPVSVVKTDLKELPDTIELRIQYVEK